MLDSYVVIDLEMTGLNAKTDRILEVGAIRVREERAVDTYTAIMNPQRTLSRELEELTGITNEMAAAGRLQDEVMREFLAFLGEDILVGQNVIFDYSFLKQWAVNHKYPFERMAVDTLKLARTFLPAEQKKNLESLCVLFGIPRQNAHRALDDAWETYQVLERMKEQFKEAGEQAFLPRPLLYRAKKQSPATKHQKEYLQEYAKYYRIELETALDGLTKSEASRLTDRLISQYGKIQKKS